jgi:ABC-2 type transport system permease protein
MTASTSARPAPAAGSVSSAARDGLIIMWRNLKRIPRIPELAIFAILQSIMFVVLFAYVFGGAIPLPGYPPDPVYYREYLMPGIFAQTIVFAAGTTAIGMADDIGKGIIDRFRSLPMARSAVLAGRTSSDILLNCLSLVVLLAVGFVVGFSFINTTVGEVLLGILLLLMLGYAFSWVFALVGLFSSTPETANSIGFTLIFPLTFASGLFVPPATMPDGLRQFAEANPFTTIADAVRALWLGTPAGSDVWVAFLWCIGLTVVFAPLAVRRYKTVAAK